MVDLSATIPSGTTAAIIGHAGSGKSTLMQMVDALILPTSGSIQVGDLTIDSQTAKKDLINVHRRVGYVFQFPEKQLFAPTVIEDVAFGPQNLGKDAEEAKHCLLYTSGFCSRSKEPDQGSNRWNDHSARSYRYLRRWEDHVKASR